MAILNIEMLGSDVLRRKAEPVETFDEELKRLIADMFETMYEAEGVGLAAPQIGISRRLIVVDVNDEEQPPFALINPHIVEESVAREKGEEGCLSIPGISGPVERAARVVVEGLDAEGNTVRISGGELLARCLQHEIDHLNGVLFIDHLGPLQRAMVLKKYRRLEAEEGRGPKKPAKSSAKKRG
jgi:peptide deformylase